MYEPPSQDQQPGCRETWVLTRAVFAILIPALLAIFAVLGAIVLALVLFARHPALLLVPAAALALGLFALARWERRRFPPPDA